jgi:hypothetical protein
MTRTNKTLKTYTGTVAGKMLVGMIALLVLGCGQSASARHLGPKTFASPAQASQALYEAVRSGDEEAVQAILGAGQELTSSGDDAADKLERERFAEKYLEMHRLVHEPGGLTILYVGSENWPFPIPLVAKNGKWRFDPEAGTQEILARRIGENEITAIRVCQAMGKTSAQDAGRGDDPVLQFASELASSGNANPATTERFHGYYFRVLTERPDGVVLLAYPAEYEVSGVMTFMVTSAGTVFEKDLGANSATMVRQIQGKPDESWEAVQ